MAYPPGLSFSRSKYVAGAVIYDCSILILTYSLCTHKQDWNPSHGFGTHICNSLSIPKAGCRFIQSLLRHETFLDRGRFAAVRGLSCCGRSSGGPSHTARMLVARNRPCDPGRGRDLTAHFQSRGRTGVAVQAPLVDTLPDCSGPIHRECQVEVPVFLCIASAKFAISL